MLNKGVEDEEEKLSIAQKMIASVESDERRKERTRILEQEMTIAVKVQSDKGSSWLTKGSLTRDEMSPDEAREG